MVVVVRVLLEGRLGEATRESRTRREMQDWGGVHRGTKWTHKKKAWHALLTKALLLRQADKHHD